MENLGKDTQYRDGMMPERIEKVSVALFCYASLHPSGVWLYHTEDGKVFSVDTRFDLVRLGNPSW